MNDGVNVVDCVYEGDRDDDVLTDVDTDVVYVVDGVNDGVTDVEYVVDCVYVGVIDVEYVVDCV